MGELNRMHTFRVPVTEQPLISVIVPIFNTAPYLRRCLESVSGQTHANIEVICVDDGSTDSSCNICQEFLDRDSRFSYVFQENAGQSSARNHGVRIATGDYVAFIDSDDYWDKNILTKLLSTMIEREAQFAMCQVVHENFPDVIDPALDWPPYKCSGDDMIKNVLLSQKGFSATVNHALFDASLVRQCKFLEGHVFEDVEYLVQIALLLDSAVAIPDRLYHYCWREGNSSTRPLNSRVADMYAVMSSLEKILAVRAPGHLSVVDQRFISNMIWMAREAVVAQPELFGEIRSKILSRKYIRSLHSRSTQVMWYGLVCGRLGFALVSKLYALFVAVRASSVALAQKFLPRNR